MVSEFIAVLQSLAEHCDYGASLDDMILDRIVVGVRDERIQRRLLSKAQPWTTHTEDCYRDCIRDGSCSEECSGTK